MQIIKNNDWMRRDIKFLKITLSSTSPDPRDLARWIFAFLH